MNRLRILRKKSGKLQREIAEYLGVNRTTYLKYENGDNEPDFATISKLADYFGVSVDYLLERTNVKTSAADKANIATDDPENKKPLTETDEELDKNIVVVRGRDGSYSKRRLTDDQIAMLKTMIDSLPDAPDDL